jgi:hypothetical protein
MNRTRRIVGLLAITMMASVGFAGDGASHLVRLVNWGDVPLPSGATLQHKPGEPPTLLVNHDGSKALALPLWKLEQPGITKKCYALLGKVRYRHVVGTGHFELWNEFPAKEAGEARPRFFSRTLAESGPMSRIGGTSEWRDLIIPFDASQGTELPDALELNLSMSGSGEIEVTSLSLVEFDDTKALWNSMGIQSATPVSESPLANFLRVSLAVGAVAVAGLLAWMVSRKLRRDAEARRMRAMDAMP